MPRTEEQNHELRAKTREKIINASMKLFAQNGYDRTSVNAIAKEAKISKGLIYNHFETKEDIVKGIVEFFVQLAESITKSKDSEQSPKEQLKGIVDNYFNWLKYESAQSSWLLPMAFQMGRYPFVAELVAKNLQNSVDNMKRVFERLEYDDPLQEAWFLGAILDGVSMDSELIANYEPEKMHTYILKKYNLI